MIAHDAESARGISPRAAHRSGRESLDSSGSCHPAKAAAFCQGKEFLRLPVDSNSTWMTCPLSSMGIAPLHHYYETVRPCPADQYFRPRGASACAFSLSTAGRFSSSVPEPGIESRHLCTGHHIASKQVSAMLLPRAEGTLRFRCRLLIRFDAFSVVHLRSSLYSLHDVMYSRLLTMTFTTAAFDRSSSWLFEACSCKPASKGLPSSPAQHHAPTSAFLTQPLHRSGRVELPHPAPTLGNDAQAHQRIRMTNTSRRKPEGKVAPHAAPRQVVTLAATSQHRPPQIAYRPAEGTQRRAIHGHSVIPEVTQQDRAQVSARFPDGRVQASLQLFFQSPQLGLPPLPHRLSQHREVPLPGFPATVRKTQEVERLRWAVATISTISFRPAAELDDSRFVGMQHRSLSSARNCSAS